MSPTTSLSFSQPIGGWSQHRPSQRQRLTVCACSRTGDAVLERAMAVLRDRQVTVRLLAASGMPAHVQQAAASTKSLQPEIERQLSGGGTENRVPTGEGNLENLISLGGGDPSSTSLVLKAVALARKQSGR
jgi:predicted nucleic acid-binding Zn ribbon protein